MPITTASAKLLEPVLQLAQHYRLDNQKILQVAGLSHADFTKPGARFPADRYQQILSYLSEQTDNSRIALSLGESSQPRMLGSIGFLMSTAATLAEAYQVLIDYLPLMFEGAALQLEQTLEGSLLTFELNRADQKTTEYFLACLINWPRWLTGHQIPARYVRLAFPAPADVQSYQRFFAAEIEFDAPRNQLLINSDYLNLSCLDANDEMHQLHREFADSMLSKSAQQSALIAQTRNQIRRQLSEGDGSVRREHIAESLNLSLRTLQRKLGQLGTSFQDIYDQTRRELCLQLIQRGQLSFGEIAYQLGFSNQSAFQKAFKRWMNIAPSQYRQQVKPTPISDAAPVEKNSTQNTDWLQQESLEEPIKQRLAQLSSFSVELLEWASILGTEFSLPELGLLTDNPVARLAIHLWPAEQAGLLIAVDAQQDEQNRYRFSHKQVQQQLYHQLTPTEQQQRHQHWGSLLQQQLSQQPQLTELQQLLLHLNRCQPLMQQPDLQLQLWQLNQQACELAKAELNYLEASQYQAQLCMLNQQPHEQANLLVEHCQLLLSAGEFDQAQKRLSELQQCPQDNQQQAATALLYSQLQQHKGQLDHALEPLLTGYAQLEHPLPVTDSEQLSLLLQQLQRISEQFSAQTLTQLPVIDDNQTLLQLQLLEQISKLASQLSQPLLSACAISRMTELSLQQGQSPYTAFAFISYSWVASWFCADYSLAQTFSAQGMQLVQHDVSEQQSGSMLSARLLHASRVQHWFAPLEELLPQLFEIEQNSLQHGELLLKSECTLLLSHLILMTDMPLAEQKSRIELQRQEWQQQNLQYTTQHFAQSSQHFLDQLMGLTPISLSANYQHGWQAVSDIQIALLLDQQHHWPTLYGWEAALENELAGYWVVAEALFCTALMRLIQAHQHQVLPRRRRNEIEQLESRLESWARHCPANFALQHKLLQAEICRMKKGDAAPLFEQLIGLADSQAKGYHPALCYERYADFLLAQGQRRLARFCLTEAQQRYQRWGAEEKVKQLVQQLETLAK